MRCNDSASSWFGVLGIKVGGFVVPIMCVKNGGRQFKDENQTREVAS